MKFEVTGVDEPKTRTKLSDFKTGDLAVHQNSGSILVVSLDMCGEFIGIVIGNINSLTKGNLGYCSSTWCGPFTLFTGKITLSND